MNLMASDLTRWERPATFDSNIRGTEFCEGLAGLDLRLAGLDVWFDLELAGLYEGLDSGLDLGIGLNLLVLI